MKRASALSLARLLVEQPAAAPACLVEPGLLPPRGILFVGGEPKVGKSLLVANLALSLAAGADRIGFPILAPRRVLVCQFELPVMQFVSRLAVMRRAVGAAADERLLVDTRASGHLLSAAQRLGHFIEAAKAAAAEVIVLDPLYCGASAAPRRKVARGDITQAFAHAGNPARYTDLRGQIMQLPECSKRTAQAAIAEACQQGWIVQSDGQYRLPL